MGLRNERLYFIDNLRVFIIYLVIALHTAMGYMTYAPEWWYVVDHQRSLAFDIFVLIVDVFIMPAMFFFAGYFAMPSLLRSGAVGFMGDKLRRIVLPWIVGVLFLAPPISYMILFSRSPQAPDYIDFWFNKFFGPYYQHAHYWFLGVLALFFLLLTLAHQWKPEAFEPEIMARKPAIWTFALFAAATTAAFIVGNIFYPADAWVNAGYLFMLQPVRFVMYALYFLFGVYGWKQGWFTAGGYQPSLAGWSLFGVAACILFILYRLNFLAPANLAEKAGHGAVHAIFSMAALFALIALFQRFVDNGAWLWRRLSHHSYGIYYLHQLVLLPLAYLLKGIDISPWLKFSIVSVSTMAICFFVLEITKMAGGRRNRRDAVQWREETERALIR
ncbi:acyltransferase family protein [Heliobacterium undosum]|uniref:Acyltransferase family protein n=1 Tax=Heliomicrobium undosum TaxID=121734 RepID=A0A845L7A3_9FIRM|nr:acyltransferase family protein [Heliomicrobium undosum]MZP30684.1 acyltransferase family protein [Heliomicrobium undosum]